MARIVVAGAGAIGASIAYHLALRGASDVVLADAGEIAGGATGKAMGGVRQQFTTEAEVRLAQASVRLFQELGSPLFEQVGYLFLATTDVGFAELEERRSVQASFGVPVEPVDPAYVDGLRSTTCSARASAARTGSPTRRASPASSSGGRPVLRSTCASGRTPSPWTRRRLSSRAARAPRASPRRACRVARAAARASARRRGAGGPAARRPADDDRGGRFPFPTRRRGRAAARDARAGAALGRP